MPFIRKIRDSDIKIKERICYAYLFSVNTEIRVLDPDKKYRERSDHLHIKMYYETLGTCTRKIELEISYVWYMEG